VLSAVSSMCTLNQSFQVLRDQTVTVRFQARGGVEYGE